MDGQLNGYPVKFLDLIVRLSKTLRLKRERVNTLKDLNAAGERRKSYGEYINEDFQRKYASTVMDLSQINKDLNEYFKNIREYTQEVIRRTSYTYSTTLVTDTMFCYSLLTRPVRRFRCRTWFARVAKRTPTSW